MDYSSLVSFHLNALYSFGVYINASFLSTKILALYIVRQIDLSTMHTGNWGLRFTKVKIKAKNGDPEWKAAKAAGFESNEVIGN